MIRSVRSLRLLVLPPLATFACLAGCSGDQPTSAPPADTGNMGKMEPDAGKMEPNSGKMDKMEPK